MLVSIVYVNYKTSKLVVESIKSVIQQTQRVDYEIIVIDNASNDNIQELLTPFSNVKLIKLDKNLGFGRGNNAALEFCNGEYIFFLNTDTVLLNDAITILANTLTNNPKIGQVGANLFTKEGKPNQSFLYTHSWSKELISEMPNFLKRNHYHPNKWFNFSNDIKTVGYVSGAATMLRKSWIEVHGGFDDDFFIYFEDMELSVRVRKSGYDVVNVPQAHICHYGGGSSGKDVDAFVRRHKLLAESKYIYYRKVKGKLYGWFVHSTLQGLYFIYATFAAKNKRKLYKQLIVNDNQGFKK